MFSLAKYAYIACNPEQREWYDTVLANPIRIHVAECCQLLLEMTDGSTDKKDSVCYKAARHGHIDCLQAVRRLGFRMNTNALTKALIYGHAECVDYMLQDGCGTENMKHTYSLAVRDGHLECVQTLLEHGVPWDGYEVDIAASKPSPDCLRFLLERGCTMHPVRVKFTAGCTDVACVKLLREYGMPWSDVILLIACGKGNYDVLKYAIENGCPNPLKIPIRLSPQHDFGISGNHSVFQRMNWGIATRQIAGDSV